MDNNKKSRIVLTIAIFIYIFFFSTVCFLKYLSFEYHDFDLAVHSQSLWNMLHGSLFNSILGINFLGNHNHLILFLLAPFYAIFPSPLTLLFLQTFFLAIGAFPLYLISKKVLLSNKLSLAVVFSYIVYPALGYTNLFEFHPTVFAVPFLLFMYYFFLKDRFRPFAVFLFLSLLCQENISLVIFMFGIFAIFSKRSKKWFLLPLLLGAVWFLLSVYIIMPKFNNNEFNLIMFYRQFGNSLTEVLKNIFKHPLYALKVIFNKQNSAYLFQVFIPLSFLPFLGWEYLFIASPLFLQHLLSIRSTEHTIYYHYLAEIIPFIFIAMIYGSKRLFKLKFIGNHTFLSIALIIIFSTFSAVYFGPYSYVIINSYLLKKNNLDLKKEEFAKKIPAESGVVASFEFLPRLANRKNLFSFHNVTTGQYPYSQRKFMAPEIVKYALIDFSDPLTMNSFYNIESDSRIKDFLSESEMRAIEIADTVVLFERAAKNSVNLFEIMQDKPVPPEDTPLSINNSIRFLGFGKKGLISQDNLNFIFYWASVKNSDDDIGICFDIIDDKNQLFFRFIRPICYNIYPTYRWQQGQFVKIGFSLILPRSLPQGKYTLLLGFVDYRKKRKIFPVSLKENILNNQGQVRLATFSVN